MTRISTLLISVLVIGLVSCGSETEQAQNLIVTMVVGKAEAWKGDGKPQAVRTGLKLEQNWTIKTLGEDANCTLQSPSGSVVRVAGDTSLHLAELYKNDKLAFEKTGLDLLAGKVLVKARSLSGDDSFTVQTRTAMAGVRGTRFVVSYQEELGTEIAVESGEVVVSQPIILDLPEDSQNLSTEIKKTLEKSLEISITPNEVVRITEQDNLAIQNIVATVVKDSLESGEATLVIEKIRVDLTIKPIELPTKRLVTENDQELIDDFKAVKVLAPAEEDPFNVTTPDGDGAKDREADNKQDKLNQADREKDKAVQEKEQEIPVIQRVQEESNPDERY